MFIAHTDAIWGTVWTANDMVISISADGGIRQWDSTSGQASRNLPPHTLGLISLSVSPTGDKVLYNSIEGLTNLWDLQSGEVLGKHESYMRAGTDPVEPCTCVIYIYSKRHCRVFCTQAIWIVGFSDTYILSCLIRSVVGVSEPERRNIRLDWWFW